MGRPAKIIPTVSKNIALPMDVVTRLELELYSDLEERIPFGAQAAFFEKLLRDHFAKVDAERAATVN